MIDYNNTNGVEVLWHLLTTEPFLWVLLGFGIAMTIFSVWFDKYNDTSTDVVCNDTHHLDR
jgi:hypothetical protein